MPPLRRRRDSEEMAKKGQTLLLPAAEEKEEKGFGCRPRYKHGSSPLQSWTLQVLRIPTSESKRRCLEPANPYASRKRDTEDEGCMEANVNVLALRSGLAPRRARSGVWPCASCVKQGGEYLITLPCVACLRDVMCSYRGRTASARRPTKEKEKKRGREDATDYCPVTGAVLGDRCMCARLAEPLDGRG